MIEGIIVSVQYLWLTRRQDVLAKEILQIGGFSMQEYLNEQKKTGFETRKMNKFIRECFNQ